MCKHRSNLLKFMCTHWQDGEREKLALCVDRRGCLHLPEGVYQINITNVLRFPANLANMESMFADKYLRIVRNDLQHIRF